MKKTLAMIIVGLLALSTFSVFATRAGAANVYVVVSVFDESGFPPPSSVGVKKLSQVPVSVFTLDGSLVASGNTDNTGSLTLMLAEGTYNFVFGGLWAGIVGSSDKMPIGVTTTKVTISSTTTTVDLYAFMITYHSDWPGGGSTFELDHIDMDLATAGYQTSVTVNPGQQVTIEMAFWELETVNVPVWYASAFGSWNPTQALSNLASGTASPSAHRLYTKQFSFTAPTAPGKYYVRLLGHHDYTWPNSYYTGFHYNPTLGRDNGNEIISKGLQGSYGIGTITVTSESPTMDISAQYSTFVSARNNYKKIFGQDVAIGQTVERTLSGVINDPPAHYQWHSWAGQTYPDPPDGFSIRIETIQPDYVYKIVGLGYMAGSQPSASGWIKVNSPFKIEQINHVINYTWSDGSNVRLFVNKDTGDITFSAKWYNYPALIDAGAFEFAITIAKPGGTLPPFSYDTTRSLASYAYDTDTKRVVMFGGRLWKATSLKSDVWTFDPESSQWTLITAGSEPSNRTGASMSYDPVTRKFLVYGGGTYSGEVSDTWTFQFTGSSTGAWTQIAGTAPPPRSGAPLVFDSKNNLFVLFGGEKYVYSLGDTWVFNPSSGMWTNKNPSPAPPQRARSTMAYDAKSGKVLLFGGLNKGTGSLLSDTWLYDAASNTWQQVTTTTAPSARQWPSLACDGNGVFYLFGGWRVDASGGLGQYLSDTWKFDMATMQWTQLFPSESPMVQSQGSLLRINSGKFVLMGGWRDSPLGEIWIYDPSQNTWSTEVSPTPDFEISISPNQITASPRFEDSFIVTIRSLNGFNSPVSLSGPEGPEISVTFADETITPPNGGSAWTTASISVLSTLPKTHTIPIGGTSGTVSHSTGIELTVPFMSVPYLSQGFTEWCGPTSIAMIVRYFGKDVHQWDVAKGLSLGHDLGSIELGFLLIKTYIVGLGLGYEYQGPPVSTLTKDVLVRMLDEGKPVLVNLNLPLGGHYVVLTGYEEDSQEFYVHDPSGALIAYTSSWSSYNSMPFSHIPVSWVDLQPYLKFAIGVQGNPEPLIGALNLIGGDKTYDRTVSVSHSTYSPWSDDVYILWSGADSPTTDGLSWKASSGHSQNLDPDDYLAIYGVPPPSPDTKLIHPLIVNPTDKSQDFQFEISFIKDGTQKWTSGKIDILDVPACSIANTPYSRTSPIRIGDIIGEYGEYTISLKLFNSEGMLIDQIDLPKIRYSSVLKVSMHSPANLFITDPLGRSIGVDPTSGQVVNQIPDATYSNTTESQVIMVPDPINGSYNIQVHGTGKGSYTLTTELVTYMGTAAKTYSGQISLDEIQTFVANISGTELALNSPSPTQLWIYIVLIGAFVAAAIVVFFAVRRSKKTQSNLVHSAEKTT